MWETAPNKNSETLGSPENLDEFSHLPESHHQERCYTGLETGCQPPGKYLETTWQPAVARKIEPYKILDQLWRLPNSC